MPSRKILVCGDPVLRKKAKRITTISEDLLQLLQDLTDTMIEAPGVGLAAPQVGASVRAIVVREDVDDEAQVHCLLNPRIVASAGEVDSVEGCLSFPTLQGIVTRPEQVVTEAIGPDGKPVRLEADGLLARAIQHEIDHLNGVLFVDRVQEDTLGWMVPDDSHEDGYRLEPTTLKEVIERFAQMQKRRERG